MQLAARIARLVPIFAAILFHASAQAAWPTDPQSSLLVADGLTEDQRIVGAPDGGFYVTWVDRSHGGDDLRLQRLDANGNEQWVHDGILIVARVTDEWGKYGLDVDAAGNAFVGFTQIVGQTMQVFIQKVAPDGSLMWGDSGLQISPLTGNDSSVSVGGDGYIAIGYESVSGTFVQKLDESGQWLWTPGGVLVADGTEDYNLLLGILADADGNVVVSLHAIVSLFPGDFQLRAQALAAIDGAPLWGEAAIAVSNADAGLFASGHTVLDGSGGAVFAWDTGGGDPCVDCVVHVQHVLADGSMVFPQNGVLASSDTTRIHEIPSLAYDAAEGDAYILWRESSNGGGQHAVYAQRIDPAGVRQWRDDGLVLAGLSADEFAFSPIALPVDGQGFLAFWLDSSGSHSVARLGRDGSLVWPAGIVAFSMGDESDPNAYVTAALGAHGDFAFAWATGVSDFEIRAQKINPDGTLGVADPIFANSFEP